MAASPPAAGPAGRPNPPDLDAELQGLLELRLACTQDLYRDVRGLHSVLFSINDLAGGRGPAPTAPTGSADPDLTA